MYLLFCNELQLELVFILFLILCLWLLIYPSLVAKCSYFSEICQCAFSKLSQHFPCSSLAPNIWSLSSISMHISHIWLLVCDFNVKVFTLEQANCKLHSFSQLENYLTRLVLHTKKIETKRTHTRTRRHTHRDKQTDRHSHFPGSPTGCPAHTQCASSLPRDLTLVTYLI